MATIYTHQSENVRKTWLYMFGFAVFIIGLGWIFSYVLGEQTVLYVAVGLSVFMSFLSYWFSDKMVIAMTGAKPIAKQDAPELYNIVENLSIAAGLPTPKIYIVNERQPNAFATGRDAKHAVVAVTRGLLERLDKTELEGVLAHELSHIGNKDMLVATIAAVLAGAIVILANIFLRMMHVGSFGGGARRDRSGAAGLMLLFGLIAAILAPIAATLLRLAISRKREFLADASGALLTRYPDGLARALEKIASDATPMRRASDATAHLWLDDPSKRDRPFNTAQGKRTNWFARLFMTHPPAEERIRILRGMNP